MEEFAALIAIVRYANPNSRVIRIRWDVRILKPFCAMYVALWKALNEQLIRSQLTFLLQTIFGSE